MKKPKVKYITGKNIKDVTVLPNFILKQKPINKERDIDDEN